jgi:multicomponent Na+:H+ antiporter subunit E
MIVTLAGLLLVWWVLAEGDLTTWPAALIALPAAALAFRALGGSVPRLRPLALLTFVPWFLLQSLRGGVDVALRALAPRVRIDPTLRTFPLRLEPGAARYLFVNVMSLLPGTFSAQIEGDVLTLHLLDGAVVSSDMLRAAERRVGALFGVDPGVAAGEEAGVGRHGGQGGHGG